MMWGDKKAEWDDMCDVLYDGSREEIKTLRCPVCGSPIHCNYTEGDDWSTFVIECNTCLIMDRGCNGPRPNAVKLFGSEFTCGAN